MWDAVSQVPRSFQWTLFGVGKEGRGREHKEGFLVLMQLSPEATSIISAYITFVGTNHTPQT